MTRAEFEAGSLAVAGMGIAVAFFDLPALVRGGLVGLALLLVFVLARGVAK